MAVELGEATETKRMVKVASDSNNESILALGVSGSGKTNALFDIESNLAANGGAVLVLDFGGTHAGFENKYAKRIFVYEEGFPIPFLDRIKKPDGTYEDLMDVVDSAVDVFGNICRLHSRQRASLRRAVEAALRNGDSVDSLYAVAHALETFNEPSADSVLENLRPILTRVVIKPPQKSLLRSGQITVLDLSGYSQTMQIVMAELTLSSLWRYYRCWGQRANTTLHVVADEFQGMNLLSDSILSQILREGRKYRLALILATQTLETFSKAQQATILQAATELFFRPAAGEARKIAKLTGCVDEKAMMTKLNGLHRGNCVAVGRFDVGGTLIERPVTIKFPLYTDGRSVDGKQKH